MLTRMHIGTETKREGAVVAICPSYALGRLPSFAAKPQQNDWSTRPGP